MPPKKPKTTPKQAKFVEGVAACAERYAQMSKRPDGSNKSMRLNAEDAIRLFQDGAHYRNCPTQTGPGLDADELAK